MLKQNKLKIEYLHTLLYKEDDFLLFVRVIESIQSSFNRK